MSPVDEECYEDDIHVLKSELLRWQKMKYGTWSDKGTFLLWITADCLKLEYCVEKGI